jgi:putative redox protein
MAREDFSFEGASGQDLAGTVELPHGPAKAWALFAHCFTCTKDSLAAIRIGRALAARGIGVLRFDFTGLGESEGEFGDEGFSGDVQDLVAAARAMAEAGRAPTLLIGHSLGGAAVLAAAGELPEVKAVATIGAPFDVAHVEEHLGQGVEHIREHGHGEVEIGGRSFRLRKSYLDDLRRHDQGMRIAELRRPLLILHAPFDQVVGVENATSIYAAARHPKSFLSLDKADHLLTRASDAEFAATMIAAWAGRYLPEEEVAEKPASDEAVVTAELTGEGKFQTRLGFRGGPVLADEPIAVGGEGSGPTPYELLAGALAACTTMTIGMYARLKGWTLPHFRVEVAHEKLADPPSDRFTRRILIADGLDPEQEARLGEIAGRCPVHRTLERPSEVRTEVGHRGHPEGEPPDQHMRDMEDACTDR